jgi:hypothetical protein
MRNSMMASVSSAVALGGANHEAKQHDELEIFGQGRRIMFWNLETSDPMSHVAEANCMSARYGTHGLRKSHRVMVTASILSEQHEHGWLRVVDVIDGIITTEKVATP